MLKDRRVLIEQEIEKTIKEGSKLYLQLVVDWPDGVNNSHTYHQLREKTTSLQFELQLINQLIEQGQQ